MSADGALVYSVAWVYCFGAMMTLLIMSTDYIDADHNPGWWFVVDLLTLPLKIALWPLFFYLWGRKMSRGGR